MLRFCYVISKTVYYVSIPTRGKYSLAIVDWCVCVYTYVISSLHNRRLGAAYQWKCKNILWTFFSYYYYFLLFKYYQNIRMYCEAGIAVPLVIAHGLHSTMCIHVSYLSAVPVLQEFLRTLCLISLSVADNILGSRCDLSWSSEKATWSEMGVDGRARDVMSSVILYCFTSTCMPCYVLPTNIYLIIIIRWDFTYFSLDSSSLQLSRRSK